MEKLRLTWKIVEDFLHVKLILGPLIVLVVRAAAVDTPCAMSMYVL